MTRNAKAAHSHNYTTKCAGSRATDAVVLVYIHRVCWTRTVATRKESNLQESVAHRATHRTRPGHAITALNLASTGLVASDSAETCLTPPPPTQPCEPLARENAETGCTHTKNAARTGQGQQAHARQKVEEASHTCPCPAPSLYLVNALECHFG